MTPEREHTEFEVEIEFVVIKRVHHILRDWMLDDLGFRASGVTVILQASSDEGEGLFKYLQLANNAREKKVLEKFMAERRMKRQKPQTE